MKPEFSDKALVPLQTPGEFASWGQAASPREGLRLTPRLGDAESPGAEDVWRHADVPADTRLRRLVGHLRSNRVSLGGALSICTAVYCATLGLVAPIEHEFDRGVSLRWVPLAMIMMALMFAHTAAAGMARFAPLSKFALVWPSLLVSGGLGAVASVLLAVPVSWLSYGAAIAAGVGWYAVCRVLLKRFSPLEIGVAGSGLPQLSTSNVAMRLRSVVPGGSLYGLRHIVMSPNVQHSPRWQALSERAAIQGISVSSAPMFEQWLTGRLPVLSIAMADLVAVPNPTYIKIRRLLDVVLALVLLVPALLVIGVAAILVKVESPGPALFVQRRTGFRRRPFNCFKLRSMQIDAVGGAFTSVDDIRITRVGRLIRKLHIDELPQIFNILRGDMSWIGPRPESITLASQYRLSIAGYNYRYMVPPGITGWAAVNQGNVGGVDAALTKLEYDFYYIRNLSPWMDLLIVFQTLRIILLGGASR